VAITSAEFWDRVAPRYSRQAIADADSYARKLAATQALMRPDMTVLEFGCGTGSTAIAHAPNAARIRAIDISPRMIEVAREKAEAAGVANVTFEVGAIEALDLPDGSVDAVLGLSILHLVEDRDRVIAKVYRLLEPGGVFVSSTMCLGDTMKWFGLVAPIGRLLGLMPDVKVFARSGLEASLTDAGFALGPEVSPILAVMLGEMSEALSFWSELLEQGVYVNLVFPPATPNGAYLMRCSVSAAHTPEQIDRICDAFERVGHRIKRSGTSAA